MSRMLIILGIGLLIVFALITFAYVVFLKSSKSFNTLSPFECGFLPVNYSRSPFSLHFFLVCLIFLIFDLELVIMFPIILSFSQMPNIVGVFMLAVVVFWLSILFLFEWGQRNLEWAM